MEIKRFEDRGLLVMYLRGDIDHHAAMRELMAVREVTDREPMPKIRLSLSGVSFMDSSGIAVVMGAYRAASDIGSAFEISGVQLQPSKVLKAAGIDRIIPFVQEDDTYEK